MPNDSPARSNRQVLASAVLGALALALSGALHALDWAASEPTEISLFLPGDMSWERTLTASSHKGAAKIRAGQSCGECHAGEEAEMGATQAQASGFKGRASAIVQIRAAVADGNLHWEISGAAVDGKAPEVAILLGNDALKSTAQAGCWAACHDDAPGMLSDKDQALGKYLSRSRSRNTATGGGDSVRPRAELDAALAAGEFLEFLEIESSGEVERGHVLEALHEGSGQASGTIQVEGSRWVARLQRPLAASAPGQIALEIGKTYHFGLAIHDPGAEGREHLVSLGHSLAIGSGAADIVAPAQ